MEIVFQNPIFLWFLTSIFLLIFVHIFTLKHVKRKALKFANFDAIARVTGKTILSQNATLLAIRIFTLVFATLALAGTTIVYTGQTNDFSFVLAIDASGSMSSDDFSPNRLESAKREAISFVNSLSSETKVGVTSFSGTTFIEQEVTNDLDTVKRKIDQIKIKEIGGTDLGEAIITSINMFNQRNPEEPDIIVGKEDKAKVLILLTDGRSNVGVDIKEAIPYSIKNEVLIYTIGMATKKGGKISGIDQGLLLTLDSETLQTISVNTGGKYYEAEDEITLAKAYKEISTSTSELISLNLALLFMTLTILLLFIEWGLVNTKYRTIP